MKYFLLSILIVCTLGCKVSEFTSSPNKIIKLYPISDNSLWGYNDEEGNIVIELQFEEANLFTNGLGLVKLDGKYGYINKFGEFEIKPKYDAAVRMINNAAYVERNGKSFQIDRNGKRLRGKNIINQNSAYCGVPLNPTNPLDVFDKSDSGFALKSKYFEAQKRLDPLAGFKKEDFIFEDVIQFSETTLIVKKEDKYGFFTHFNHIGLRSIWVDDINLLHQIFNGLSDSNSYCMIKTKGKWGLVHSMGKIVIEPKYLSLEHTTGMYYLAEYQDNKLGFVNYHGREFFK